MKIDRNRERFETLQAQIRALLREKGERLVALHVKYGSANTHYASKGEKAPIDRLNTRIGRLSDKLFALLADISPRDWRSGVPCHWAITKLTYDDATTRDALSVIPPAAYGYTEHDARMFAAALPATRHEVRA